MHLTLLALGSRGDVQPYAALGKGLRAAELGERIRAENGIEQAVAIIERHVANRGR